MKMHGNHPRERMALVLDSAINQTMNYKRIAKELGFSEESARDYIDLLEKTAHTYVSFDIEIINKKVHGELLSIRVRIKPREKSNV